MKSLKLWRVLLGLTVVAVFASVTHAETTTHHVEIQKLKFVPATLDVAPGDIIVWTNLDIVPHTVTALDGSWDSGNLDFEAQWSTTVTATMSSSYICRYHPAMKGALGVDLDQSQNSTMRSPSLAFVLPR